MASSAMSESTPLLPQKSSMQSPTQPPQPPRTVTFSSTVTSSSLPEPAPRSNATQMPGRSNATQPVLATLNNKLRRRYSQGATPTIPPVGQKIGPQRTTKTAQKLKILPNPEHGEEGPDEESGKDVYAQYTRIKDPTARRDAARLGKADRERLPRVTAYCTAESYQMDGLMSYLKRQHRSRGAAPKRYDECIYSPYKYAARGERSHRKSSSATASPLPQGRRYSDSALEVESPSEQRREDLIDLHASSAGDVSFDTGRSPVVVPKNNIPSDHHEVDSSLQPTSSDFLDTELDTPELFLFDYGALVVWGMTLQQEKRFLKELSMFELEKMEKKDVQSEEFNFYFTTEYNPRIYNDFISLNGLNKKDHMTRLAISHALAQSVKTSLYEELAFNTIESTKMIPSQIALTGKVELSRTETNMQIGQLFLLKINIHMQGSVLDAPELLWSEPQLEPVYKAARDYLEMDQRVQTLTQRLDVIADLLSVLTGQQARSHEEFLEWIVIVLIAAEVCIAVINIIVDVYAEAG